MPQLPDISQPDLMLVNERLLELYRVRTPAKQTKAILELADHLAPSFIASITRFNVRTRKLEVTTKPWLPIPSLALNRIAELAHESPFPAYFAASGDRNWRTLDDFMPPEEFQQTRLFKAMFSPIQCTQIISTMLASLEGEQISLTLCRRKPAYTPRERALLNLVIPHLSLSYNNAEIFERVRRTGSELKAVVESSPLGYAYVNTDGRVAWATNRARELWRQFYPAEADGSGDLPRPVQDWLCHALARLAAGYGVHVDQCFTAESGGTRLEMRLSPSPFDGGVLTVDAVGSVRPRFQPLQELTERENEVLRWMLEGKRNAEIAALLNLSPRTVEKHVQSILSALGVENRATAIIRAMELAGQTRSGGAASVEKRALPTSPAKRSKPAEPVGAH